MFTLEPPFWWLRGGLFHYQTGRNGQSIMSYSSTVQVLKVVIAELKNKAGEPYQRRSAEVLLLNDKGNIEVAGALPLTKELAETLKPGIYRAGFSMVRQEFGDRRGDIVSRLVSLVPAPMPAGPSANLTPKAA